ncbi:hypothetical protein D3C80_682210 [compost metagenome]
MSSILPSKLIIRTHNRIYTTINNSCFKSGQINFAQGSFTHLHINGIAIDLFVIGCIMFNASRYALILYPFDVTYSHFRNQVWVFTQVFKITATQRRTNDIYTRSKNNIFTPVISLTAQYGPKLIAQIGIPGSC